MRRLHLIAAVLLGLWLPVAGLAQPLTIGDTSVDQRVLTRPNAILFDAPEGDAISRPPVFSSYYVFERSDVDGTPWIRVGANRSGTETFWMREEFSVDWKQTIVLAFTNPDGRTPSGFFGDKESLVTFLRDEAMSTRWELCVLALEAGNPGGCEADILSIEPDEHISMAEQFYMLPVLDHDRVRVNRRPKRIVEIASINLNEDPEPQVEREPLKVGIVFVIDTSTSMQPYIDSTLSAVREVLSAFDDSETSANFSFGLVGFRSDIAQVPGLEYRAKSYFDLAPEFDEAGFLRALGNMSATRVSSHDFDEDGLAGLSLAGQAAAWNEFQGRFVIYMSDAGMLVGTQNGAGSEVTPDLMATRFEDKGIYTIGMLLKTRAGRAYHDDAIAQLERLTLNRQQGRSFVYPIENGDADALSRQVERVTDAMLGIIEDAEQSATGAAGASAACEEDPDSVECAASQIGNAIILTWLGQQNQTQAPDTYRAWVADFALEDPRRLSMSPRVLLTRAQLNDVYVTLQAITEAFQQSDQGTPEEFFQVLGSVLARVMRDPSALPALNAQAGANIASVEEFEQLGDLLGEYLDDLPYDSDLASETLQTWIDRGPSGRHEFIEGVRAKLAMYELYYADTPNWISLTPGAEEAEKVYPLPLEMMP